MNKIGAEKLHKIFKKVEHQQKYIKKHQDETDLEIKEIRKAVNALYNNNARLANINNFLGVGVMLVFGAFVSSSFLYVIFMYLLTIINVNVLQSLELFTSWLTTSILIFTGIWGAYFLKSDGAYIKNTLKPWLYAFLSAPIFACYLGYISIDFGAINALASAIGFNIATILKCMLIIMLLVKKE